MRTRFLIAASLLLLGPAVRAEEGSTAAKPLPASGAVPLGAEAGPGQRMSPQEVMQFLAKMDQAQKAIGDWKATFVIEDTQGDNKVLREGQTYNNENSGGSYVILFTKPKTEQGSGYLKIDRNLWFFDARIGRWDRRTERERIGGSNFRQSDFSLAYYQKTFDVTDEGTERVGEVSTRKVLLKAKPGSDAVFPVMRVWVNGDYVPVKEQDFSLSGKLLRTEVIDRIAKLTNPETGKQVSMPQEMRAFDELEKDRTSLIVIKDISLAKVPPEVMTKAWLEGMSR